MAVDANDKVLKSDSYGLCDDADLRKDDEPTAAGTGVMSIVPDLERHPDELKWLVRKIDKWLLPFMVCMKEACGSGMVPS